MKQQDILAVMKHIVARQVDNTPDKVFRFKTVSKTRKTRDEELRKPAKYPGDPSDDSEVPSVQRPPTAKKTRKPRAKKTAPQDKVGRALQQEMEGLLDLTTPATADSTGANTTPAENGEPPAEQPEQPPAREQDLDPLDIAVLPNYGGIPNFGPNDPVQYPWPKPAQGTNAMFGRYRYPVTPGPIEPYPAGIPPEDIGVIDPSLIGLRANPVQLPTPRASVTPQLSPLKLRSDSSATSHLRFEVNTDTTPEAKPAPNAKPPATSTPTGTNMASEPALVAAPPIGGRVTRSRPQAPAKEPAKAPAKRGRPSKRAVPVAKQDITAPVPMADVGGPPKPRPRGKAAKDLAPSGSVSSLTNLEPAKPAPTPGRRTADVLAAAEAAQLDLPSKRVRTAKVRST